MKKSKIFTDEYFTDEKINEAIIEFRKKEKGDGKRGPFYQNGFKWIFEINNENLFKNAVWQGYLDACRTFKGIKTEGNTKAFDNLADAIQGYFKDERKFEHENWCNNFIKDLEEHNKYKARYGQAQKVVNMAFKYLYCCIDNDDKVKEKFRPCHMPLDQYTLMWYSIKTGTLYEGWSYFDDKTYKAVAEGIRNYLGEDILGKEAVIWSYFSPNETVDLKNNTKKS